MNIQVNSGLLLKGLRFEPRVKKVEVDIFKVLN